MGEQEHEVLATLADLRAVGVEIVTVGQYLPPEPAAPAGGPVVDPRGVRVIREAGMAMGFAHVQASPLTRSSYHAREADRGPPRPGGDRRSPSDPGPIVLMVTALAERPGGAAARMGGSRPRWGSSASTPCCSPTEPTSRG